MDDDFRSAIHLAAKLRSLTAFIVLPVEGTVCCVCNTATEELNGNNCMPIEFYTMSEQEIAGLSISGTVKTIDRGWMSEQHFFHR